MTPASQQLVSGTGEPAWAVDRRGEILAWNDAATRALGYTAGQAVGQFCWQLLRGRDVFGNDYCGRNCPHRAMAAHRKPIHRAELRFATPSGERKKFTVSTLCLFDQPNDEVLIHLCRPGIESGDSTPWAEHHLAPFRPGQGPSILTPRETEVLRALAEGRSTREVATLLSISIATVRNHVQHLLDKLDCHSRLEAVTMARRLRLI